MNHFDHSTLLSEKLDRGSFLQWQGIVRRIAESNVKNVLCSVSELNDRDTMCEGAIDDGVAIFQWLADSGQRELDGISNGMKEFVAQAVEIEAPSTSALSDNAIVDALERGIDATRCSCAQGEGLEWKARDAAVMELAKCLEGGFRKDAFLSKRVVDAAEDHEDLLFGVVFLCADRHGILLALVFLFLLVFVAGGGDVEADSCVENRALLKMIGFRFVIAKVVFRSLSGPEAVPVAETEGEGCVFDSCDL